MGMSMGKVSMGICGSMCIVVESSSTGCFKSGMGISMGMYICIYEWVWVYEQGILV